MYQLTLASVERPVLYSGINALPFVMISFTRPWILQAAPDGQSYVSEVPMTPVQSLKFQPARPEPLSSKKPNKRRGGLSMFLAGLQFAPTLYLCVHDDRRTPPPPPCAGVFKRQIILLMLD